MSSLLPSTAVAPQILLVKTSSLGDVVHNLPVIDDLRQALPGVQIDWLVEQAFADVPRIHPGVRSVIPCAMRRWRRTPWSAQTRAEWRALREALRAHRYDLIIDSQGLLKSAVLACQASGPRAGFDRASAREPLASFLYQRTFAVPRSLHAVERNRELAAQAAGYRRSGAPRYGLGPGSDAGSPRRGSVPRAVPGAGVSGSPGAAQAPGAIPGPEAGVPPLAPAWRRTPPFAVLLHATARAEKLWPEPLWIALARELHDRLGLRALLPWGSPEERERSERLAAAVPGAEVPPREALAVLAGGLAQATVVIGVDTGLLHLASAVGARCIGLYVATDPARNGLYPDSVGLNLGGPGIVPGVAEVLAAVSQVTAWLPAEGPPA